MKRRLSVLALLLSVHAVLAADAPGAAGVAETREALSKWGETRKLSFQERSEWEQGREVLESRIELASKEVADLEKKLAEARAAAAILHELEETGDLVTSLADIAEGAQVSLKAAEAGLALLESGGDFADAVIAHEGRWLGADTFVSFDKKAAKLLQARGEAAQLLG